MGTTKPNRQEEEQQKIKLNSMVRIMIRGDTMIGQVVEINEEVYLIRLMDNMHYRARLGELRLLTTGPITI